MTFADFQTTVLAFLNRNSADIPAVGAVNLITVAANAAKLDAQRRHQFKMARMPAFVTTSLGGAALSTATIGPTGTGGAVNVKRVEQAWLYALSGGTAYRYKRVPYMTLGDLKFEIGSATLPDVAQKDIPYNKVTQNYDMRYWIQGVNIFLLGVVTPGIDLWVDVIPLMPDYTGSNTDFFLDYHWDWLVYATLQHMNQYLKEDQRVSIDNGLMEKKWKSVTAFDENFGEDSLEAGSSD